MNNRKGNTIPQLAPIQRLDALDEIDTVALDGLHHCLAIARASLARETIAHQIFVRSGGLDIERRGMSSGAIIDAIGKANGGHKLSRSTLARLAKRLKEQTAA